MRSPAVCTVQEVRIKKQKELRRVVAMQESQGKREREGYLETSSSSGFGGLGGRVDENAHCCCRYDDRCSSSSGDDGGRSNGRYSSSAGGEGGGYY